MNTIKHREVAIMRLRAENTQLRKALRINGRNGRRIQRAYDAALMLASWHIAYLPTSREFAMSQGMSQRQWENGTGLLKLARVVRGRRWQLHDLATIEQRLQAAADRACMTPDAFLARLNRHARS